MKPIVYSTVTLPDSARLVLEDRCSFRQWKGEGYPPRAVLMAELAEADGVILKGSLAAAEFFDLAPNLKVVAHIGVGYDNIDITECRSRGVIATHTPSVLDDSVADLIFGLLLSATRRIAELDKAIRAGGWKTKDSPEFLGRDLARSVLGIIGMGRVGEALARRARLGFDMDILYFNRSARPRAEAAFGAVRASLEHLLKSADHVVMLAPLTEDTRGMIGSAEFAQMKTSATFINASRGPTIDERALVTALRTGAIRAAGLDVFDQEPIKADNPLLSLPNVTLTPHIGSATAQTREKMALTAAYNVVAAVHGDRPPNVVPDLHSS